MALQRGDKNDPARMKAIGGNLPQPQRVEQRNIGIGEISYVGLAGKRLRLAEPRRVGRDTGEMRASVAHQRLIFLR